MRFVAVVVLTVLLTIELVTAKHKKHKNSKRDADYDMRVVGKIIDEKSNSPDLSEQSVHPDYPLMSAFKEEDVFTEQQLLAHNNRKGLKSKKSKINKQKEHEKLKRGKSLEERLEDKLEQVSLLEGELFDVIKDVKALLKIKKQTTKKSMLPHLEELSKRSDLATITNLRKSVDTDRIIDDILRESDDTTTTTGNTRDTLFGTLSDDDPAFASQNEFISNSDDSPISKIDEESERKESMANARDVIQDGLVESPFSDLDFKKPSGKKTNNKVLS